MEVLGDEDEVAFCAFPPFPFPFEPNKPGKDPGPNIEDIPPGPPINPGPIGDIAGPKDIGPMNG